MALFRLTKALSPRLTQMQNLTHSSATKLAVEENKVKPFSEMPAFSKMQIAVRVVKNITGSADTKNAHWANLQNFKLLGPVFRLKLPAIDIIMLKDITSVEKFLRLDGKYPERLVVESWREWRERNKESLGPLTLNGPAWKRQRRALDKKMMRPNQVKVYTDRFNSVVTDFVDRLKYLQSGTPDGVIRNMNVELFNWSLETIGTVLYETRFGGLDDNRPEEMQNFIKAVETVFATTGKLFVFPRLMNKFLLSSSLKDHDDAWMTIFTTGKKYIDIKMQEIDENLEKGEEVDSFLASILWHENLSQGEVYSSTAELMLAAVETTSNTMQWVIEELARNPDIQRKLHQEVTRVVPTGKIPSNTDIQNMPYLKAIIKEVLRLYPVAGTVTRLLQEDTVIYGYLVPAKTTVLIGVFQNCRDPDIFPDPNTFIPERWLRDDSEGRKAIHNFAWLPFGFGSRMCLGRRVAELELRLLTARISQMFTVEPADDEPLKLIQIGMLIPDRPVTVKFIDR